MAVDLSADDVGQRHPAEAVVVGGSNADVRARTTASALPGTSNPGIVRTTAGGVGRNIAEVLARLGSRCALVSVVGSDPAGAMVLDSTAAAGVDVDHVLVAEGTTGTYVAVLGSDGDLVTAVSDMAATDRMPVAAVDRAGAALAAARVVVLDGNLPTGVLERAWDLAAAAGAMVVLDPVSVPKAGRLAHLLDGGRRLDVLTPNRDELAVGLGRSARSLLAADVGAVWERLGAEGSRLHLPGRVIELPARQAEVVDATGAGDAMVGGMVHAVLGGADLAEACAWGHDVAAAVVASPLTVPHDLAEAIPPPSALHGEPRG